jgi:hypothetical protein
LTVLVERRSYTDLLFNQPLHILIGQSYTTTGLFL